MRADRWSGCPKCEDANSEYEKNLHHVEDSYGEVSMDRFLELQENLKNMKEKIEEPKIVSYDLREDFVIGLDENGLLLVDYTAKCKKCDFRFRYYGTLEQGEQNE